MDLCIVHVPEEMELNVAISFLADHAFDWYKVICNVDQISNWPQLKSKLQERFQPMNKVKAARDKLAVWKQVTSVALFNESFLKLIIDIPNISQYEVIDRYMRGLKPFVSQELSTKTCNSLTTLISDALSIEASKASFSKFLFKQPGGDEPVPMYVSNTVLRNGKNRKQFINGGCRIRKKRGCHSAICPHRPNASKLEMKNQGKDFSQ